MSPKNHETKVRFGEEDYQKLQRKAEKLGLKVSTYIRMVSLNFNINELKGGKK